MANTNLLASSPSPNISSYLSNAYGREHLQQQLGESQTRCCEKVRQTMQKVITGMGAACCLQLNSPPFVSNFCGMMKTVHSQQDTGFFSPVLMPVKGYDHSTS